METRQDAMKTMNTDLIGPNAYPPCGNEIIARMERLFQQGQSPRTIPRRYIFFADLARRQARAK